MQEGGYRTRGFVPEHAETGPLVSIITVVRNGERHLRQTIESVLNQSYPHIEYIVIDGASTDGSLNIIREYDDRIAYWRSAPDGGIYDAMNIGIGLATGAIIGLKNADDWYTPDAIAQVVATYQTTHADAVYGDTYVVWSEQPLKTSLFVSDHTKIGVRSGGIDHRNFFLRAELYHKRLYDTRYKIAADYDLMLALKLAGVRYAHTGTVLGYKRAGGASSSDKIYGEFFAINRRQLGLAEAITTQLFLRGKQIIFRLKNSILRLVLGPSRYNAFKARSR